MSWLSPGVYRNLSINGEKFACVVATNHESTSAITAVHTEEFDRTIGGARFVTDSDLTEVGHLSQAMTEKCMAARIPAGGQKTVIRAPQEVIDSLDLRAGILAEHIRETRRHFPGVIFGPDMNAGEDVQDRLAEDLDLRDFVTGLSESHDGLSIDLNGYTAFGLREAVRTWRMKKQELLNVSVQGFGAVGAHIARMLHADGFNLCAISNQRGLFVPRRGGSLPVQMLFDAWISGGDRAVFAAATANESEILVSTDPLKLYEVPTDIFIPAARTSCFGVASELAMLQEENHDARDVIAFAKATGVKLIVEGANHPLSAMAEIALEDRSVAVLPDYIVNCGGLIGCWIEWQCRHDGTSVEGASRRALQHITDSVHDNVTEMISTQKYSRRAAEDIVARNRMQLLTERVH